MMSSHFLGADSIIYQTVVVMAAAVSSSVLGRKKEPADNFKFYRVLDLVQLSPRRLLNQSCNFGAHVLHRKTFVRCSGA